MSEKVQPEGCICEPCLDAFDSEDELKKVLKKRRNLDKIEPRLKLPGQNLKFSAEYPVGGGKRMDLLCWNTYPEDNYKTTHWVVVELKAKGADCRAFGQILLYMLRLKESKYFSKHSAIRGVILAEKIKDDLLELVQKYRGCIPEIRLLQYKRVTEDEIEIEDVSRRVPNNRSVSPKRIDM